MITIWVMVQDLTTKEQWEENWKDYPREYAEEHAVVEVYRVTDRWNATLRKHENPRQAISFVLEEEA
jgi:hypothetical protein